MEETMETTFLNPILSILALLCAIVGLWIAGRLLPSVIVWLKSRYPDSLLSGRFSRIALWIALGAIFTFPLLDFISWIRNLVSVILIPQSEATFSTMFGTVSPQIYLLFPLLLMTAIYGIIFYYGNDYISKSKQFHPIDRIFIVLTIASLVYQGIYTIFAQVVAFQLPLFNVQQNYGAIGYLVQLLVGGVVFLIILFGLNRFLPDHPLSKQ
jgi:hypothetical protein